MHHYKELISLLLPVLAASACGKQPIETEKIPIRIASTLTRATDSAYEEGDAVGLYVTLREGTAAPALKNSGNHADNVSFTLGGGSWAAETPLYWQDDKTHADFYCYYPFQRSVADVRAVPVSVKTDQRGSGYKDSEWLWGTTADVAPTSAPVSILTRHVLSNLLVVLKPGKGYSEASLAADVTRITLHSLKVRGTLDLSTGQVTPAGEAADIIPAEEAGFFRAMVIPQALDDATLLSVEVGGYTYSMKQTITFVANKQHTCTVTVNKTSEGLNIGISDWETDGNDYGGAIN